MLTDTAVIVIVSWAVIGVALYLTDRFVFKTGDKIEQALRQSKGVTRKIKDLENRYAKPAQQHRRDS